NFDAPAGDLLLHLPEENSERVGLLPGGRRRAPDADAPLGCPRREQRRHDGVAEMIEWNLVAEEERLVGRHRVDDVHGEPAAAVAHFRYQFTHAREARLAGERQQPAFDQILLFAGEREARLVLEQFAKEIVVEGAHVRSPAKIRKSLGAMSSSGSTAEQAPAWAAEPGMPQTMLVASSWAITLPPAAAISTAPCAPSVPIPVRITASAATP